MVSILELKWVNTKLSPYASFQCWALEVLDNRESFYLYYNSEKDSFSKLEWSKEQPRNCFFVSFLSERFHLENDPQESEIVYRLALSLDGAQHKYYYDTEEQGFFPCS